VRTFLSTALIVLLAVLTPLSAIAAWLDLEIGDADSFVSTMAPLASRTDVQDAVTERITHATMRQIDAGPFQDRVRGLVHERVRAFTSTDAFPAVWDSASRTAQATVEEVLTDENSDAATIDLAPAAARVRQQLIAAKVPLADRIPLVRHISITVLKSDRLGAWRGFLRGLRSAGIWPLVATLVLGAAAVALAARRRRALIVAGLAFAAGGVLLGVVVMVGRGITIDDLSPVDRSAAAAVYDALTGSLRTTAWAVFAAGLALAAAAWVTGLRRFRRRPGDGGSRSGEPRSGGPRPTAAA
jgi:hypothetical protein